MNGSARYDGATIWLHWITVALVAFLWASGQIGDDLPKTLRAGVWSLHVLFGIALGSVLIARLAWRTQFGRVLPAANAGLLRTAATVTHYALYALLVLTVVTGLANASYRGFDVFGVVSFPQFGTGDRAMRHTLNEWHELAANALFFLAVAHSAAALAHHYIWRDRLLDRMTLR